MDVNFPYPPDELVRNMILVMEENNLSKPKRDRLRKRMWKLHKQDRLTFPKMNGKWIWRLCAADLMRGNYRWIGYETRSEWALAINSHTWLYPKWTGGECKLLVLAEQGIGDEIVFASTFSELLHDCPSATIECDNRLIPVFKREFGDRFISRWADDEKRLGKKYAIGMEGDTDYKKGEYDAFVPAGDLLRIYRTQPPPGAPFLRADPGLTRAYRESYETNGPPPYIGLSWRGGRSLLEPENLMRDKGTYISLQYGKDMANMSAPGVFDPGIDHNDMEQVFAAVNACDYVVSVQSYIVHVCGSIGRECHAVKPPPIYGESEDDDNNRLKWYYGINRASPWKMPWWNSVKCYAGYQDFQQCSKR